MYNILHTQAPKSAYRYNNLFSSQIDLLTQKKSQIDFAQMPIDHHYESSSLIYVGH